MGKYLGALITIVLGAAVVIGLIVTLGAYSQQPAISPYQSTTGSASSGSGSYTKTAHITLQTLPASGYTDPEWLQKHGDDAGPKPPAADHQDWVMYWPTTQIVLPAHALVTVTIENWDSQSPLLNPFYAIPQGIQANSMTINGQSAGSAMIDGNPIATGTAPLQIDPNVVAHTFTIHSIPDKNQPYLYVSVPITGVPNDQIGPDGKPVMKDGQPVAAPTDDYGFPLQPEVTQFQFITGGPGEYIWQCFDPCGTSFNQFGGPMQTRGWMSGTITVQ